MVALAQAFPLVVFSRVKMSTKLLTTSEAATELGVTPGRVRQMVLEGELIAEKFGRDLMITGEAVVKAKQRKKKPGPAAKAGKPKPKK